MKKKRAFTLAEVLVVLALVGFLFTLTLPNMIQKQGSAEYIKKARNTQLLLQEALNETSAVNHNYTPDDWETVRFSENKSEAIIKELSKRLKILSYCGNSPKGCFAPQGYRTISGIPTNVIFQEMKPNRNYVDKESFQVQSQQSNNNDLQNENEDYNNTEVRRDKLEYTEARPQFSSTYISLLEGGSVVLKTNSTYCNGKIPSTDELERQLCGTVFIDVNGPATPNMLGVDVFGFYLSGNSLLPMGFYGDDFSFNTNCLRDDQENKFNGLGCSAWALVNKNMDYRKCVAGKIIDWTTKTKCDAPAPNTNTQTK